MTFRSRSSSGCKCHFLMFPYSDIMDLGLNGRTALITGATKGIGRATAELFLQEGARVIINGRSEQTVNDTVRTLQSHGDAVGVAADVATATGCQSLVEQCHEHGPVDILVNNAGIFQPESFEEISDDRWREFFELNVMSGVRLARAFSPGMRERGWGRIIFVSSESGENIPVEMIHYGTTKAAQQAVARGLARHLAGTGVTVNSVLPGPTWTDGVGRFVERLAHQEGRELESFKQEFVKQARPTSLTGRFAEAWEPAAVIAFACSKQAGNITGAPWRAEGGIINTGF